LNVLLKTQRAPQPQPLNATSKFPFIETNNVLNLLSGRLPLAIGRITQGHQFNYSNISGYLQNLSDPFGIE